MKNLTNILLVIMVILCVGSYMKKNHISIKSPFKPKVDPLINLKIRQNKVVFTIHGLGDYDNNKLYEAQRIIKEVFGLDSKIGEPILVSNSVYTKDGLLNLDKVEKNNYLEPHIYISNSNLLCNNELLWGATRENEMFVSMNDFKRTLSHEIGHWECLDHCNNSRCMMNITVPNLYTFCNSCQTKLNRFLPKQQ